MVTNYKKGISVKINEDNNLKYIDPTNEAASDGGVKRGDARDGNLRSAYDIIFKYVYIRLRMQS